MTRGPFPSAHREKIIFTTGAVSGLMSRCPLISGSRLYPYGITVPTRSPRSAFPFAPHMGAVFIITRQKKKTRTESARIKNQKCGISKVFRVVAAIAAGVAYCNAPPLIPQGQKRKMFLTAEIFLKLFLDTEKATRLFTVGWWCIMFGWISRKLLFIMTCFESNRISKLNSTLNQKPVRRTL